LSSTTIIYLFACFSIIFSKLINISVLQFHYFQNAENMRVYCIELF
jgi:hypothetical protein